MTSDADDETSLYQTSEALFGRASGYRPMPSGLVAAQYRPVFGFADIPPPPKVDLRPLMAPIDDQGDTSSCVAHAVAGAYDYWLKKSGQTSQNLSRMFIYYNARLSEGCEDKDEGCVIHLAMDSLKTYGACPEVEWPFDTDLLFEKPVDDVYQDAAPLKVDDLEQMPVDLDLWRKALAEGKPIVFGCLLYKSFDSCDQTGGVVPMPAPEELGRKKHSSHSMCAVGYNDAERVFIVRNSWGTDFGDQGYCYMPYAYLTNPKLNEGDCWVFKPQFSAPPPQETWSNDPSPVTNGGEGVDFPIEAYSVEDYAHIALDLFLLARQAFVSDKASDDVQQYVEPARQDLEREIGKVNWGQFASDVAANVLGKLSGSEPEKV
jgi:hypothetical protein